MLPEVVVNSMGVATHLGVSEDGAPIEKKQDHTQPIIPDAVSGGSVNSQGNKSELEPCMYSYVLL